MTLSNRLFFAACVFVLTCFKLQGQTPKKVIGTFSYKLGTESKSIELKSLFVKFKTTTYGDPGKEKTHTTVNFSVNDTDNNRVFAFTVKEDDVVNELNGIYTLRPPGGTNQGTSLRSAAIMIVDTKNSSNICLSTKGNSDISISGTSVKISIKNAEVSSPEKQLPFEFSLTTDQAKVKMLP